MLDSNTTLSSKSSLKLFFLILALTFLVEASIMVLSQILFAEPRTTILFGIVDASILTAVMAPAIWLLVVRPIQILAESREQLLHALLTAQEQERSRIARDLHDEIGQQLTAMQVGLGTIEASHDLHAAKNMAADLRKVGATAHEEVRRLSSGLRPGVLEELGLVVALERLCEDFEERSGLTVRRNLAADCGGRVTLPVETALYRILQESLTNVAKHAQATIVEVGLVREHDRLVLMIADDGKGLEMQEHTLQEPVRRGLGVSFIRERVQMLEGTCTMGKSELGGALIKIDIRIPQ